MTCPWHCPSQVVSPHKFLIRCSGTATVPCAAEKSKTPACTLRPAEVASSNSMAPFLGASCDIKASPADFGSRTCSQKCILVDSETRNIVSEVKSIYVRKQLRSDLLA